MKLSLVLLAVTISGCAQKLPEGTDNVAQGPQWERVAEVSRIDGLYKVVDTEDAVICYYTAANGRVSAPNCLSYYAGEGK